MKISLIMKSDFILYANKEQGHNPLEKAESIAHIQSVLNKM